MSWSSCLDSHTVWCHWSTSCLIPLLLLLLLPDCAGPSRCRCASTSLSLCRPSADPEAKRWKYSFSRRGARKHIRSIINTDYWIQWKHQRGSQIFLSAFSLLNCLQLQMLQMQRNAWSLSWSGGDKKVLQHSGATHDLKLFLSSRTHSNQSSLRHLFQTRVALSVSKPLVCTFSHGEICIRQGFKPSANMTHSL